jgi:hypothetical protein
MFMSKKHKKTAWVSKTRIIEKPWGEERVWSGFTGVHGKSLFIRSGHKTSLKYNTSKNETLFLRQGSAIAIFGNEYSISDPNIDNRIEEQQMEEGDVLHVQSACPYRLIAIEDCEFIEIGDSLTSSAVRIEDDYGRCDTDDNTYEGKNDN